MDMGLWLGSIEFGHKVDILKRSETQRYVILSMEVCPGTVPPHGSNQTLAVRILSNPNSFVTCLKLTFELGTFSSTGHASFEEFKEMIDVRRLLACDCSHVEFKM